MDNFDVSQWLQVMEAVGTCLAALVALFTVLYFEIWLPRRNVPDLDIEPIKMSSPDCFKISIKCLSISSKVERPVDSYFLRFRVINKGRKRAENVEVFASKLTKKRQDNDSYEEVVSFLPMHLTWSFYGEIFIPTLSPKMFRHCDIAHIINPKNRHDCDGEAGHRPDVKDNETVLSFDTIVKPHTLSYLQEPGSYRLTVVVAANNSEPVERCLEIDLSGTWSDEETDMLTNHVKIRLSDYSKKATLVNNFSQWLQWVMSDD